MNKKFEKTLTFISVGIMLFLVINQAINFINNQKRAKIKDLELVTECKNNPNLELEREDYQQFCQEIMALPMRPEVDIYTAYLNIVIDGLSPTMTFLMLFTIMPALLAISKYLKNNILKNDLTRINYKQIKKKILGHTYKFSFLVPVVMIISLFICLVYTQNFDTSYAIEKGYIIWNMNSTSKDLLFWVMYLLNIWIHSILYINLGLCIVRKNHNYFVSIILTFLLIMGIEAILEIVFGGIIVTSLLKSPGMILFNIMNSLSFNDQYGMGACMIVPLIIMIISGILVQIFYKNPEKLMIDCEQND